jgi:hypothetical protein
MTMSAPPARPKLYHITHVDNLQPIAAAGELVCDAAILAGGGPAQAIGMSAIKRRRLEELEVACHPGTKVGDYVPFYFCPRSVMLYVIHCANHPELTYHGGQEPTSQPLGECQFVECTHEISPLVNIGEQQRTTKLDRMFLPDARYANASASSACR